MTKEGIMLVMLWPLALDLNGLIVNFFFLMANLTGFHKHTENRGQKSVVRS